MKIGNYQLEFYPKSANIIDPIPKKYSANVLTYDSFAYFSWGSQLSGQSVEFDWDYMSTDDFNALNTLYQADVPIVWDLVGDGSKIFNVIVTELEGKYCFSQYPDTGTFRSNVKMVLLIES